MKKIILSVIAVLAFGFANAQGTKFGAKAAVNFANLPGDLDGTSLVAFQIGGFAEFKLSESFAVQPELMYSAQGTKFDFGDFMGVDLSYKAELSYINLPIMAKYYVGKSFSLEAGPQVGFLMSAKVEGEDAKDSFNSVDFGLNFGLGYDFGEHVNAGLRYNLGLSNVLKTEEGEDASAKNSVISLSLGYKF